MNIFTDKYFTKSRLVSEKTGINPVVKYRVFGRFEGIAALGAAAMLVRKMAPKSKIWALPGSMEFNSGDTLMIIEDRFQNIVELETMYLQWVALPCYCAYQSKMMIDLIKDKDISILDFAARHLFGPESVALASYGAEVGGITSHSTDIGMNALDYLEVQIEQYKRDLDINYDKQGVGTIPHALIAIFKGDYLKVGQAYLDTFPENEKFIALIDYNNREIDDSVLLWNNFKEKLYGVRIDTPGENVSQYGEGKGVTFQSVKALKEALVKAGGDKVKLIISSGFNVKKIHKFIESFYLEKTINNLDGYIFDSIGTGSFIPNVPYCTADIFEVDGEKECKVGREWGYEKNDKFMEKAIEY